MTIKVMGGGNNWTGCFNIVHRDAFVEKLAPKLMYILNSIVTRIPASFPLIRVTEKLLNFSVLVGLCLRFVC